MTETRILLVCLGNICRSPTAHGVLEALVQQSGRADIVVDSAGTSAAHAGSAPDPRSMQAAAQRGYELGHIRSRKIVARDYQEFDLILAMDEENLQVLQYQCPAEHQHKLKLFLEYSAEFSDVREVPDPYYAEEEGFEYVLDLVESAARGVLKAV